MDLVEEDKLLEKKLRGEIDEKTYNEERDRIRNLENKFLTELARTSELCYIVVNCGYEGIDGLLWVGKDKDKAREIALKSRKMYGERVCVMYPRRNSEDDQEEKFEIECVCKELNISIGKLWLY